MSGDEVDDILRKIADGLDDLSIHDLADEHVREAMEEREAGIERARRGTHPVLEDERQEVLQHLSEDDRVTLLGMTMKSLRGNWTTTEEREALVHWLCDEIGSLPETYLARVKWNAFLCNGHHIDGRIFRDGDRRNGLHGSMASMVVGDDRTDNDGWHGTYQELWEMGHEPDSEEKSRLSKYIPNDLTYTEPHETCVFKEDKPIEPDLNRERPRWTEICDVGEFDSRVPKIITTLGTDGETTAPFGVRHVLRPTGGKPVVVLLA